MNYEHIKSRLDYEVEFALKNPHKIEHMWKKGGHQKDEFSLFAVVTPDGEPKVEPDSQALGGCLTQIRLWSGERVALLTDDTSSDKTLTEIITNDRRIPESFDEVGVKHLQLFYNYQLAFADYTYNHKDADKLMKRLREI